MLFEVPSYAEDIITLKRMLTETCAAETARDFQLKVPLVLHFTVGRSWGRMSDVP
jgi:hypothetical protein